jgi:hypothetical protein
MRPDPSHPLGSSGSGDDPKLQPTRSKRTVATEIKALLADRLMWWSFRLELKACKLDDQRHLRADNASVRSYEERYDRLYEGFLRCEVRRHKGRDAIERVLALKGSDDGRPLVNNFQAREMLEQALKP